jgi:hypothetical protein
VTVGNGLVIGDAVHPPLFDPQWSHRIGDLGLDDGHSAGDGKHDRREAYVRVASETFMYCSP